MIRRTVAWAVILGALGPGTPLEAVAQDPSAPVTVAEDALDRVEELARAGRAVEARVLLSEWWEGGRRMASRDAEQRAIWLRGVLTVDPGQASLDYWRLVVEYPLGPYTARALARIAGAADVSGDRDAAVRARETLVREHRGTPEAQRARAWLDARGEDPPGPVEPAARPPDAGAGGGEPTAGAGDEAGGRADPAAQEEEAAATRGDYAVQLGAFSTMTRARELMERARAAGLEPRLVRVPGSALARVRVGRFTGRAAAEELRRRIVGLGLEALVSEDASSEQPVGGA